MLCLWVKNHVKVLCCFLFGILIMTFLILFFSYTSIEYDKLEKNAQWLITDNCILNSISFIIFEHYDDFKHYPDKKKLDKLILKAGYPGGLGCGPTSIKYNGNIVDTVGNEFIYEYKSSDSVKFYFDKANDQGRIVHEFLKNELIRKK